MALMTHLVPWAALAAALLAAPGCESNKDRPAMPSTPAIAEATAPRRDAGADADAGIIADARARADAGDTSGADVYVFSPRAVAPGSSWTSKTSGSFAIDLAIGGVQQQTATSYQDTQRVEVTAVRDGVVAAARLTYLAHASSSRRGEKPARAAPSLAGKTFLVEWSGEHLKARREDGAEASEDEQGELKHGFQPRKAARLELALRGLRFPRGAEVELPLIAFSTPMGPFQLRAERAVATYGGREPAGVRLQLRLTLVNDNPTSKIRVESVEHMLLDANGWRLRSEMKAKGRFDGDFVGRADLSGLEESTPPAPAPSAPAK